MSNKFTSRKFIVWIVSTIFMIGCFAVSIVNHENDTLNTFIGVWGGISMLYIGGNVAQDFICKDKSDTDEGNNE